MTMNRKSALEPMPPVIRLSCDLPGFLADWRRCDQLSNYLAESLSLGKVDPFAFSSLLSTMVNEVLETIFYHNTGQGRLNLQLSEEDDEATVLRAEFAVDREVRARYEHIIQTLASQDPVKVYEQLLFQLPTLDARDTCLYEIAADYGARLSLEEAGPEHLLRLVVRMELNAWLKSRGQV